VVLAVAVFDSLAKDAVKSAEWVVGCDIDVVWAEELFIRFSSPPVRLELREDDRSVLRSGINDELSVPRPKSPFERPKRPLGCIYIGNESQQWKGVFFEICKTLATNLDITNKYKASRIYIVHALLIHQISDQGWHNSWPKLKKSTIDNVCEHRLIARKTYVSSNITHVNIYTHQILRYICPMCKLVFGLLATPLKRAFSITPVNITPSIRWHSCAWFHM
jgi:hypothetical protein